MTVVGECMHVLQVIEWCPEMKWNTLTNVFTTCATVWSAKPLQDLQNTQPPWVSKFQEHLYADLN